MFNCAIVCEYNPFHSGHLYQINRVRELGAKTVYCVMSGNFVQSAMPAFCDKTIRAACAVSGGADAVIELPVIYATASAGYFADGALKIISQIKDINKICMGATAAADDILRIADVRIKHAESYDNVLKNALRDGKSYKFASAAALSSVCGFDASGVINEPNNMLCVEYIVAISRHCANIEPIIIKRCGADHNDDALCGEHVSASAIRAAFDNGNAAVAEHYIPYKFDDIIKERETHAPDINAYKKIAVFALKRAETDYISSLRDCAAGMEYLAKDLSALSDYDEILSSTSIKKYGKKRMARLMLDCVLGIKKSALDEPFCTRLLACGSGFDFGNLPAFVCAQNSEIKRFLANEPRAARSNEVDVAAASLYSSLTCKDCGYYNYSLVKA